MSARVAILFLISTCAFAQAWVPPKGTASITIGVQHTQIDSHTDRLGRKIPDVNIRANALMLGIDYSLTDRLALGLSLPYVSSRYRGSAPHPGIVDDGRIHGTLQDLRIDLRCMALEGPVVVSPTVSWTQPSRDYETLGHAAAGRGLEELELGVSIGGELVIVPGLFFGSRGAYTFVERVDPEISVDRVNAELEAGYAVGPRLFMRVFGAWQNTRDGLTLPLTPHDREHHFQEHDQLLKAKYLRAGAGLSVALTNTVEAYLIYVTNMRSENAHSGETIGIGTSWSFSPRTLLAKGNAAQSAARQLRRRDNAF